jgi:release factor glutamine methyltransferase
MTSEIRKLIDAGAERLARVADDPRREAEILLAASLGWPRASLIARPGERISDREATSRYEANLRRRASGEPVAYILGEKEFWSLTLTVTPDVLIPRPETELLVERALGHLPAGRPSDVLDLATGSGAIALAIARERPQCRVTGTDIYTGAIVVAEANARRLGLENARFRSGDWYEPVAGMTFHLITCNPPYVADDDPCLEPSVRRFEPARALYAGPGGLEALDRVIAGAAFHLAVGGRLLVEHGLDQAAAVRVRLADAGFDDVRTHRDLAGHERCTEGQRGRSPLSRENAQRPL